LDLLLLEVEVRLRPPDAMTLSSATSALLCVLRRRLLERTIEVFLRERERSDKKQEQEQEKGGGETKSERTRETVDQRKKTIKKKKDQECTPTAPTAEEIEARDGRQNPSSLEESVHWRRTPIRKEYQTSARSTAKSTVVDSEAFKKRVTNKQTKPNSL
jgi:hypothetical protein